MQNRAPRSLYSLGFANLTVVRQNCAQVSMLNDSTFKVARKGF